MKNVYSVSVQTKNKVTCVDCLFVLKCNTVISLQLDEGFVHLYCVLMMIMQ